MYPASELVPTGTVHETEVYLCNNCINEEASLEFLSAHSQLSVESTSASAAEEKAVSTDDFLSAHSHLSVESTSASAEEGGVSAQPSAERNPAEIPTQGKRRNRIRVFYNRMWKAAKKPHFCCRWTRVESLAPHQSDLEPASDPGPFEPQNISDTDPTVPEVVSDPGPSDLQNVSNTDLSVPEQVSVFKRMWKATKMPFLHCRWTKVEFPAPRQSVPESMFVQGPSDPAVLKSVPVPGPSDLQNVSDTDPSVPEPVSIFKRTWKSVKKLFLCCRQTKVEFPTPRQSVPESMFVQGPSDPAVLELVSDPGPSDLQNVSDTDPSVPKPVSVFKRARKAIKFPCCRRTKVEFLPFPEPDPNLEPNNKSLYELYKVQDIIGRGSYGKVSRAIRKSDGQQVAIKTVQKRNNCGSTQISDGSRRVPTEVGLMVLLKQFEECPYIIKMHEWFDQSDEYSIVLELPQPCVTMLHFITDSSGLTEPIARYCMCQLVKALQYCINHGVFHNDIHANNVLVNTNTLGLKLIDFGSGHCFDSDGYDSKGYIGALAFCPPEVFLRPKYHAVPTNTWALGVMLYFMVCNRMPFSSVSQMIHSPVNRCETVSEACNDLIFRCLNRNPKKRLSLNQIELHKWWNILLE